VTLKIAMSMDGCIALADGSSRWITGEAARAHTHALRARCDGIVVGGGTLRADAPRLDVRLPGMKDRSPARYVLSRKQAPEGWHRIVAPEDIFTLGSPQSLLLEGGAGAAAAFLRADLVDRICIYRAPIIIGSGLAGIGDIGLSDLADAHGRWAHIDTRMLGTDTLEVYERA
jgi:diaminohydroxyphosphoribosylaminopyrimidine deaminase/5-amino-6-(5-phosphoribosylamino)uracil reductase